LLAGRAQCAFVVSALRVAALWPVGQEDVQTARRRGGCQGARHRKAGACPGIVASRWALVVRIAVACGEQVGAEGVPLRLDADHDPVPLRSFCDVLRWEARAHRGGCLGLAASERFFPAAGMFFITITAGNAVVSASNVDTFIVTRSVVPIPCAILEALVLHEPYPPPRSWAGLAIVLLGAVGFCMSNQGLLLGSASWVLLYLALMPLDGVLIKQLVSSSGLSPWGLVLYNNACAVVPGLLFSLVLELGHADDLSAITRSLELRPVLVGSPVLLSCWCGLAISFFQLNVRKVISSTAFMVLGVSNKILSVLFNQLARLDSNSDALSVASVFASILGAILFQQTVQGKGLSQAPPTDPERGQLLAQLFVGVGIVAAAVISVAQRS